MQQKKKTTELYVIFSDRVARYIGQNGIFWHSMRHDNVKDRSVFLYEQKYIPRIEQLIEDYKKQNKFYNNF